MDSFVYYNNTLKNITMKILYINYECIYLNLGIFFNDNGL